MVNRYIDPNIHAHRNKAAALSYPLAASSLAQEDIAQEEKLPNLKLPKFKLFEQKQNLYLKLIPVIQPCLFLLTFAFLFFHLKYETNLSSTISGAHGNPKLLPNNESLSLYDYTPTHLINKKNNQSDSQLRFANKKGIELDPLTIGPLKSKLKSLYQENLKNQIKLKVIESELISKKKFSEVIEKNIDKKIIFLNILQSKVRKEINNITKKEDSLIKENLKIFYSLEPQEASRIIKNYSKNNKILVFENLKPYALAAMVPYFNEETVNILSETLIARKSSSAIKNFSILINDTSNFNE